MSMRAAQRRHARRTRPAPELVAAGLVVVLYAGTLGVGPVLLRGATSPVQTEAPRLPSPSPSTAVPSSDPLQSGIAGVLAIDARLTDAGQELKEVIGRSPFRGSEAAVVLRRIKVTLVSAGDRVAALAVDPATREIGAQLEILYASADRTVERASNLALGSDREYREAAAEIVDLFRDLPAIDARLQDVLAARTSSPPPPASPSADAAASPSGPPSAVAIGSAPIPSANPAELLRDPGFETGLGSWTRRATGGAALPVTGAAEPLGTLGNQSLRVDVPATGSLAIVSIGQGPIALHAGTRYVASVAIRADATRSAQLRVVGPAEETYGIALIEIGPQTVIGRLEFMAVLDQPAAMFWIDLSGTNSGTVWLDDASLIVAS
jgi:hypothetical protein